MSLLILKKKKIVLENDSVWWPSADKSKHLIIGESQAEFSHRSELKVWSFGFFTYLHEIKFKKKNFCGRLCMLQSMEFQQPSAIKCQR